MVRAIYIRLHGVATVNKMIVTELQIRIHLVNYLNGRSPSLGFFQLSHYYNNAYLHQEKDEEKGEGSKDAAENNPENEEEETEVRSKEENQMDVRCDLN